MSQAEPLDPAGFVFHPPSREVLERTLAHGNGDLTIRGPGGDLRLEEGTRSWEKLTEWLADDGIEPVSVDAPTEASRKWEILDQLYSEAVMGTPEAESKVPSSPEVDVLRERIGTEIREMMDRGVMPYFPD